MKGRHRHKPKTKKTKKEEKKLVQTTTKIFLPGGLPEIILDYLSDNTLAFLGALFFFGTKELITHRAAYCALWGQPEEFKTIVTYRPDTLLSSVKEKGPNGSVEGTPYQLLLWADDNYIKDEKDKTFLGMASNHLPKKSAEQQQSEWFASWDEKKHVAKLQAAFTKIAKAFDESTAMTEDGLKKDDALQKAIESFTQDLKAISVTAKRNCIPQLWNIASQFYTYEKYKAYGGTESPKNQLFCFRILGLIDSYLPAWALQAISSDDIYTARRADSIPIPRQDISFSDFDIPSLGINSYKGNIKARNNCQHIATDRRLYTKDNNNARKFFSIFCHKQPRVNQPNIQKSESGSVNEGESQEKNNNPSSFKGKMASGYTTTRWG